MKKNLTNKFFIYLIIFAISIVGAWIYLPIIALLFLGYSFYGIYKLGQKLFSRCKNKIILFVGGFVLAATALIVVQFSGALYLGLSWVHYDRYIKTEVSPDGKITVILSPKGNNKCFTVKIEGQVFYTRASIYHNTKVEWQNNEHFVLKSSDVGDIEFRKENGAWKVSPESLIRPGKAIKE